MKIAIAALAAALLVPAAPARAQTDVTGDWEVTMMTPQGGNTVHVTFKQDGEKLSGVLKSPIGQLPFDGGSVVGTDLKFGFSIPIQGQALEITMTGKVDGSTIAGKAQFGGFGEGDWTAKRAEATAATAASATPAPSTPAGATAATSGGASAGLSGTWDVTVKTQMGEVPATAEITESAGKISGTITGPSGPIDISGTLEGNVVKLAFVAKTPQGEIPVSLSGELSGDSVANGKAEFGGMEGEWSAKRKQ
jgi:hypothetical protein